MTEVDLRQVETELDSTLEVERETEESSELDDLFAEEESSDEAPVTREEYNRLLKGVKKLASEQGRVKQVVKAEEPAPKQLATDDVSELFFAQIPQAELVSSDLKSIADKLYDGSILKAWRNETWIQEKAKALSDAKTRDEENRSKISKPSNGTSPSRTDISKVKAEEIDKLTPSQKVAWIEEQVRREQEESRG